MTPQEFITTVNTLKNLSDTMYAAASKMDNLATQLKIKFNQSDPFFSMPTQEQINAIINVYGPLYIDAKSKVQQAAAAFF